MKINKFWCLIWCNYIFRNTRKEWREWKQNTDIYGGGGVGGVTVCEGHEVADWVFSVKLELGFHPQHCQHFRSSRPGLHLSSAQQTGRGSSSEQELASAPCQNHFNFTTHGTCEHDTGARQWIILSRLGPSEMNVLSPHHLISLSHSLSPAWFGFPPAHQNILSHMNPLDESLRNAQSFILDCVWPMEAYLPCVHLTEISTREKKKGRSKTVGVSSNWEHARVVRKVSLKVALKEKKHMCLFSIAAERWWWCIRRE